MNDDNAAWLKPAYAEMYRVLKDDSFCVSFYGWPQAARFMDANEFKTLLTAARPGEISTGEEICTALDRAGERP